MPIFLHTMTLIRIHKNGLTHSVRPWWPNAHWSRCLHRNARMRHRACADWFARARHAPPPVYHPRCVLPDGPLLKRRISHDLVTCHCNRHVMVYLLSKQNTVWFRFNALKFLQCTRKKIQVPHHRTFMRRIHWWPLDSVHKGPVNMRTAFPCHVFMLIATTSCNSNLSGGPAYVG